MHRIARGLSPTRRAAYAISMGHYQEPLVITTEWFTDNVHPSSPHTSNNYKIPCSENVIFLMKIDLLLQIWGGLMIVATKAVFENFEEFKKLHAAFEFLRSLDPNRTFAAHAQWPDHTRLCQFSPMFDQLERAHDQRL